jgi:alpha-L-fucosidase 2
VRYRRDGVTFEREVFASYPDKAIIVRLRRDRENALKFRVDLDAPHPTAHLVTSGNQELALQGKLPGIALRRTLDWVEGIGDQWKYPEIWTEEGHRSAKQILYAEEVAGPGMSFEARVRIV